MCPERLQFARGFSLVPALFLLVVLAGLGVVAVRVSAVQSQTFVLGLQAARAYAAAQSGIEWTIRRAVADDSCGGQLLTMTEGGLDGFAVQTSCSRSSHSEGGNTVQVFVVEAFASHGSYGNPDYVSRRLRVSVTDAG